MMQSSAGDVKDDAAGVLRNCSNYSVEATEVIKECKAESMYDEFAPAHPTDTDTLACVIPGHSQVSRSVERLDRNVQRRGIFSTQPPHTSKNSALLEYNRCPLLTSFKIEKTNQRFHAILTRCVYAQHKSDRFTAMGTIQNLTRCKQVLPLLCQTAVITDAVIPILNASGSVSVSRMRVGMCVRVCVNACMHLIWGQTVCM